ncbi:MAG: response regulator [Gammaproteobacteria bacterium]
MKRILIVEDEPHIIRILRLALERNSYQVCSAIDGKEGLASIQESEPDVLITDIDMPVMSGDQLCKHIEAEMPDRKFLIIVLTSRAEIEHRQWSAEIPNLVFLEKPISIRRLVNQLEDYFAEAMPLEEKKVAG